MFIKYCTLVFILAFATTGFTSSEVKPTAIISFNNDMVSKKIVYFAYRTVTQMDKPLYKLLLLELKILSEEVNPETSPDIDHLNAEFQAHKQKIARIFNKSRIYTRPPFITEITIEIKDDGYGNHYLFSLPHLDFLGFYRSSIYTKEEALDALQHITTLIEQIDSALPMDTSDEELSQFSKPVPLKTQNSQIILTEVSDSKTLLASLISLKKRIIGNLDRLRDMAKIVANGNYSEQELAFLSREYESSHSDLFAELGSNDYNPLKDIKLFHNVWLNFEFNGVTRNYFFPKINLTTLNMDQDTILSGDAAGKSLSHTNDANVWIMEWPLTGNTPFIKDQNPLDDTRLSDLKKNYRKPLLLN